MQIELFDSLAHPTLTGTWLGESNEDAHFSSLLESLERSGFSGACAVGLDGVGGYSHERFAEECRKHPSLIPVAGFSPKAKPELRQEAEATNYSDSSKELERIKALGYRAIKIHPRISKISYDSEPLFDALRLCSDLELTVFLCTYWACHPPFPETDPYFQIAKLLNQNPRVRVVLVHGGGIDVLRYSELARFNPNLLLDLSLTLCKYEGSSVDCDLRFLFRHFDRRICIGSDHPEYSHAKLRMRFEELSLGLDPEKTRNIASKNILAFLGK